MSSADSSLGFDSTGLGDDTVMLESLKSEKQCKLFTQKATAKVLTAFTLVM